MAWSTRQLAELAGTSVRAVRHYHDVGLLPEPERRSNGYKQYGVPHLVRLLRIKRLVDLGFSLPQIAELGDADEHPEEALRALDADLEAQIDRLRELRGELAELLDRSVPTDLPKELAAASEHDLSKADRNFVAVMGRTLGPEDRELFARALGRSDPAVGAEFERLADDADDAAREDLARRMYDDIRAVLEEQPGLLELGVDAPQGTRHYVRTVNRALVDLYNPAQLDVLRRVGALRAREQ